MILFLCATPMYHRQPVMRRRPQMKTSKIHFPFCSQMFGKCLAFAGLRIMHENNMTGICGKEITVLKAQTCIHPCYKNNYEFKRILDRSIFVHHVLSIETQIF